MTIDEEEKTLKCREVGDDDKGDKDDDKKPAFLKKKDDKGGDKDDDDKDDKKDKKLPPWLKKKNEEAEADGQSVDDTEMLSLADYAKAIAHAAVLDKPADVSQVFGDAIRHRMADIVADYNEHLLQNGFETQDDEAEEEAPEAPAEEVPEEEIAENNELTPLERDIVDHNRKEKAKKKKEKTNEAWANHYETPKSKRGMFKGRSLGSLEKEAGHVHGTKAKQVDFAIRAKKGWKGGV